MKVKPIAKNQNVLILDNGAQVLFSYETPVAYIDNFGAYKTKQFYSTTTSRHINRFLKDMEVETISQTALDTYLESSK
tara:strand:+ start:52 stop:285 length:234 start_codon:yes stop_codon:yes gene_type:complete